MSEQVVSDRLANILDKTAHLTALHVLLVVTVKSHPAKEQILEAYRLLMADVSERIRAQEHPDAAQADPILVQAAEGSAEALAQIASGSAHLVEKIQEYAERLLRECQ